MEIVVSIQAETPLSVQSNHRSKTDTAWKYVSETQDETGKKVVVCTFCQKGFRGGGINRMKQHLAGVKGNVASCVKVPADVKLLMQGILDGKSQQTKEKPSGSHVHNLDGDKAVEAQTTNSQKTHANEGKRKAPSNLPSNPKRVLGDDEGDDEPLPPGIRVSKFDQSVENHFKAMDKIATLSGESEFEHEQTEIHRLSASVTFLSQWRYFCYQPRDIRFACEKETSREKNVTTKVKLPQFSSAVVPKDIPSGNDISSPLSKDFVMYVGGPVWALDWCPGVHQSSTFDTNVEFIAVSAHPPESTYHKIGAPLTGRGLIQIWCVLNTGQSQEGETRLVKVKKRKSSTITDPTKSTRPRGRPRKTPRKETDHGDQSPKSRNNLLQLFSETETDEKFKTQKSPKPRGRPRKKPIKESSNNFDDSNNNMQLLTESTSNSPKTSPEPLAVKFPDNFTLLTPGILAKAQVTKEVTNVYTRRPKKHRKDQSPKSTRTPSKSKSTRTPSESKSTNCQTESESQAKGVDPPIISQSRESPIDEDDVLPRLVMGLAHNGKVAWDVKWRPSDFRHVSKHVMGYLAVLLGNGALEVWEVPLPRVTKAIFSCQKEGKDPRFLKLKPVFLCSMLKCGDRQSIPLTLEWSTSAPHDLILAGCHDGVVALWKFSASSSSKDTRPLLCFSADTVPIRALTWAPLASDPESANIIATGSHKGLKFWDIRDPFHPLWDIPYQKVVNSLEWLPDPRCVVLSFDDGEIKIISLLKAASDVPVTGMPCDKKPLHGSYSYYCSSSSIWSVQVSSLTGMVAYCCSDGKVINFQLTIKAVEKDPHRNREPHYLCGSLTEEEDSSLTVLSPLPDVPIPMKRSSTEWGDTPKTSRGVKSRSNQEKRAKGQISKFQTPPKPSSGDPLVNTQKNNNDTSREAQIDNQTSQALVCIDDDNKVEETNVKEEETDVYPPKIVAMHRVRWNMNKGSERLVCYGGAAGILRCQKII
ncbi:uncharacterized protein LOC110882925 [Helianthus annuus]|nr:uncharacterized protein LOC110882925 [Helianthus annuus]